MPIPLVGGQNNIRRYPKTNPACRLGEIGFKRMCRNGDDQHIFSRRWRTIFASSYDFTENKSGGTPLKVFIIKNTSAVPDTNYSGYSNLIDNTYIEGFLEGLPGLIEGESKTIGPLPPEKAYGFRPKEGDELNLTEFGGVVYQIVKIKQNTTPLPEWIELGFDPNTTLSIYTLRDQSHNIGENIDLYPAWENSSSVTRINDTLLWIETTLPDNIPENFTWTELNQTLSGNIQFPEDKSTITLQNDTHLIITHNAMVGDNVSFLSSFRICIIKIPNRFRPPSFHLGFTFTPQYLSFQLLYSTISQLLVAIKIS